MSTKKPVFTAMQMLIRIPKCGTRTSRHKTGTGAPIPRFVVRHVEKRHGRFYRCIRTRQRHANRTNLYAVRAVHRRDAAWRRRRVTVLGYHGFRPHYLFGILWSRLYLNLAYINLIWRRFNCLLYECLHTWIVGKVNSNVLFISVLFSLNDYFTFFLLISNKQ